MEHNKSMTDLAAHLKTGTTASNDHGELFVRHSRACLHQKIKIFSLIFSFLFFPSPSLWMNSAYSVAPVSLVPNKLSWCSAVFDQPKPILTTPQHLREGSRAFLLMPNPTCPPDVSKLALLKSHSLLLLLIPRSAAPNCALRKGCPRINKAQRQQKRSYFTPSQA